MDEEEKRFDLFQMAFESYFSTVMADVYLEDLLRKWLKEIQRNHRHTLTTLDALIGKTIDMLTCLNTEIEVHHTKSKIPDFGVYLGNDIEYYVFKDQICIDAFLIPNELIPRLMSKELAEGFMTFGEMAGKLKDNLTEKQLEVKNLFSINSKLN